MYNQHNHYQTNNSKAYPGGFGFIPPISPPTGGFKGPNADNSGGFVKPISGVGGFGITSPTTGTRGFRVPVPSGGNPGGFRPQMSWDNSSRYPICPVPSYPKDSTSMDSISILQSPISSPYPYPHNPNNPANISYPPPNPADLQRRFYGICSGCSKPNSDFAECASCKDWILQMETMIKARKSLIDQQLCTKCKLSKHVHSQIAACAKCGFPKSSLAELNKVAIKNENENSNNSNNDSINSSNSNDQATSLTCGNCNDPLENYLKCPTLTEIAQRMRKERECLPYEDPNFAKLSKVIKHYSDLERQNGTNSK